MLVTTIVGLLTVFHVKASASKLRWRDQIAFVVGLALTASLVLTLVAVLPTWATLLFAAWQPPLPVTGSVNAPRIQLTRRLLPDSPRRVTFAQIPGWG